MKNIYLVSIQLLAFLSSMTLLPAQAPVITSATPTATTVEQWHKFEVKLGVTANWSNPYDYADIRVAAVFTDPDGQTSTVDGFFMQEYDLTNTQTGTINPVGSGVFKVRFAPNKPAPGPIPFLVPTRLVLALLPDKILK